MENKTLKRTLSILAGLSILTLLFLSEVFGILTDKDERSIHYYMEEDRGDKESKGAKHNVIVVIVSNPGLVEVTVPEQYDVVVLERAE